MTKIQEERKNEKQITYILKNPTEVSKEHKIYATEKNFVILPDFQWKLKLI